jgi:hypothetical protein
MINQIHIGLIVSNNRIPHLLLLPRLSNRRLRLLMRPPIGILKLLIIQPQLLDTVVRLNEQHNQMHDDYYGDCEDVDVPPARLLFEVQRV